MLLFILIYLFSIIYFFLLIPILVFLFNIIVYFFSINR
nr:MAG TPA: hypothetical protein [Caudoviricetes sp.]DAN19744.1 MAG TPA: hypothetical protein [Caudoviricetes sp.]DAS60513.1 MAG TPA: hypothetical protein [Caudoviricetes sp.]